MRRQRSCTPEKVANGFTLVELLVALFVFGLLATAGMFLLSSSADGQQVLSVRLAENGEIVRAATLVRTDASAAIDRPARAPGGGQLAAFDQGDGLPGGLFAMSIVTSVLEENGAQPDVERIGYAFEDGALVRYVWAMPDGSSDPVGAYIVEDLKDVSVRFRNEQGEWSNAPAMGLPRAMELRLTSRDGVVTHILAAVGPHSRKADDMTASDETPADEETVEEEGER